MGRESGKGKGREEGVEEGGEEADIWGRHSFETKTSKARRGGAASMLVGEQLQERKGTDRKTADPRQWPNSALHLPKQEVILTELLKQLLFTPKTHIRFLKNGVCWRRIQILFSVTIQCSSSLRFNQTSHP